MSITFNSLSSTAKASQVAVEQEAVSRGTGSAVIPRKALAIGQYNSGKSPTDDTPQLILSKSDAWDRYGRGSQLAAMVEKLLDYGGGVPVYALPVADDGSAVDATGTFAISGTATAAGTLAAYVAGVKVSVAIAVGDAATDVGDDLAAAINAKLDLPVTAANVTGTVTCTSRWAGESANQIQIEMNRADTDATPAGLTVVVTDMASGATDPTLTTALGNLGDTWYTEIAFPYTSAASLTALESAGDTRVGPTVKRPFAALVGYTDTYANFITALGSRNSEWTTFVPVHGSPTPAYVIAAAATAIFARYQQTNPGRPMKTLTLPGVIAGTSQNTSIVRDPDTVVAAGGSWTKNQEDDTVTIGDLVTTRITTDAGADTDAWTETEVISRLQFMMYSTEQAFLVSPYDRAVALADGSGRGPTWGIRPSDVKTRAIGLVDDWVERGLATDRDTIVAGIVAEINADNAGRIDLLIPVVMVAGLRIVAVKLEWAFYNG